MSELRVSKPIIINNNPLGESMVTSDPYPSESLLFDDQFLHTSISTSIAQYRPEKDIADNSLISNKSELPALRCPATDCDSRTSDLISQYTVSCSEACELLFGYVRKKQDLMSLQLRLQDRYRNSLVLGMGAVLIVICCLLFFQMRPNVMYKK